MGKHKKHIISILFFIVFNIIYFGPLFSPDKKVLYQSDKVNYKGMSKEIFDHRKSYNEDSLKPQDTLTIMFSFKNVGSYRSTNLAVSENDKQDIRWESNAVKNELFN